VEVEVEGKKKKEEGPSSTHIHTHIIKASKILVAAASDRQVFYSSIIVVV
jgi:hypothetical protein